MSETTIIHRLYTLGPPREESIVVFGCEYYYDSNGLTRCEPRQKKCEEKQLGKTGKTLLELEAGLSKVKPMWTAKDYNPKTHNGQDFLIMFIKLFFMNHNIHKQMTKSEVKVHKYRLGLGKRVVHTSVVVFGWEYTYGQDGFLKKEPLSSKQEIETLIEILKQGKTEKTEEDLDAYIRTSEIKLWLDQEYNLLDHNCQDFSNKLCGFLKVSKLPMDITKLAATGRRVFSSSCSSFVSFNSSS